MRRRFRAGPVIAVVVVVAVVIGIVVALTSGSSSDSTSSSSTSNDGSGQQISQLNVGVAYTIPTLDAAKSGSVFQTLGLGLEGLVKLNSEGKIEPWLAESIEQPNDTTYVYHLRSGVKFWDGHELSAEDVVNTIAYYSKAGSLAAHWFTSVKNVAEKNAHTIVVTLTEPDASWPWQLAASPGIFEKQFQQEHKTSFGKPGTLTMGTGPWEFTKLDPSSELTMSANPDYWHGAVNIGHIAVTFFKDETSEALAFRTGEIEVAFPYDTRAFASTSGATIQTVPGLTPILLELDTVAPPWNDVHVRRAVAYAIDRKAILKALGASSTPTSSVIPQSQLETIGSQSEIRAMLASLPQYPHDLAKARAEMAKSQYPDGAKAEFNTLAGYGFSDMAQVIKSQLEPIGIDLTINTIDQNKWLALLTGSDRKAIGIQLSQPAMYTLDPGEFPGLELGSANAKAGGFNDSMWAPKDVDALIAEGRSTSDPAKRLAIYSKLLERVATDVPIVALGQTTANVALGDNLAWPTFFAEYEVTPWALEIEPK